MTTNEEYLFWMVWGFGVYFGLLILLNFIIAEVTNSYEVISENITEYIYKERILLVAEAE